MEPDDRARHLLLLAAILLCGFFRIASTGTVNADEPTPAVSVDHLYARMVRVHSDLETIATFMGRTPHESPAFVVRNVGPREVYFQSLVLLRFTNRFAFDHTRKLCPPVDTSAESDDYAEIDRLIGETLQRLSSIRELYGIAGATLNSTEASGVTPVELFESVVLANRKLNALLDVPIAPGDVFEQVTVGIGYTSRILEQSAVGQVMPSPPNFEPNKKPADVYARLLGCLRTIQRIAEKSGLEILELDSSDRGFNNVQPGDVLNLASLVVSEIAYLHSQLPNALPPREVYSTGRKFPAHVYQRVGILERQLQRLDEVVNADPHWLSAGSSDK
ncbi:hypothetical protein [Rhodopirellula sp. MGV]|uniref:hypothetical protein n=1 Tax=Rhodopirellula sp. MGV TaxID=2023130 RepID=UPI000B978275|nr:hypothetical protein [Rhodopirellula sp. MGV]OYP34221.1 hypothetical protein CGZ80_15665 [Rhodopirellula sp. MGV]PNY35035.1 hypothetical protein C2E31_20195 [Rhodopirellula baltica]